MVTALACFFGLKQTTYDMTGIYTKKGDGLIVNGRSVLSWSTGTGSVYIIQKGTTLTFNGDSKGGHLQFTGVVTGNRFKVTSVDVTDDVAWDSSPARRAAVRAVGQRDSIEGEAESEDVVRLTYRSAVFEFDDDRLVAVKPVSYPVILERQYITVNSVKVGSERSAEELRKISDLAQAQLDTINGLAKQIGAINDQIDRLGIEQEETRDALRAIEPGRVAATRKLNAQKLQSSYLDSLIRLKESTASGSASSADLDELRRLVAIYEDTCAEQKCPIPPAWKGATLAGLRSELAKQNAAEAAIRAEFRSVMDQGYALNRKLKNAQGATQDLVIKRSRLRNEVAVQTATLKALMANPDAAVWPGDCFPKKLQFMAKGKLYAEAEFGNPLDLLEHLDRLTEEAKVSRESLRQSADALREAYKFAVNEEQRAFGSIAAAQVKSLLAQFGVEAGDFVLQIGKEGPAKAALGKLKDIAKEAQVKLFEYANRDPKKGPMGKLDIVTSMWDYDVYDQGELRKKLEESEKIPERALAEGQDMAGELFKQHVVDSESYLLFFKGRGERIGRWLAGKVPDSRWTKKAADWFEEAGVKSGPSFLKSMFKDAMRDYAKGKVKKALQEIIEKPVYEEAFFTEASRIYTHKLWMDANSMLNEVDALIDLLQGQAAAIRRDYRTRSGASLLWTKKDRMPAGMDYNLVLLLQGPPPRAVDLVEKDFGPLKLLGQAANRLEFLHEGYQFERKSDLELSLRR